MWKRLDKQGLEVHLTINTVFKNPFKILGSHSGVEEE